MNQYTDPAKSTSLADVFKQTLRSPGRIIACTLLGLGAGLAVANFVAPSYQTDVKVLIERRETPLNEDGSRSKDQPEPIDERLIASQVAVIESKDFAARIARDLKLDQDNDFAPKELKYGTLKSLLVRFGFSEDRRSLSQERRAVDEVANSITVFPTQASNVINIKVDSGNPERAALIANRLAEEYIRSTSSGENDDSKRIQEWLSAQINELRSKVSDSEAEVERFRSNAGLLKGTNSTLGVQEISELNTQLTLAETAQSEAAARAREIKSQLARRGSVDASSDVLTSPVIQSLQQQKISAERQLTELSTIYLPNHPKIRAATKTISEIERLVRREALKVVEGLDGQAKIAEERANAIRDNLDRLKERESAANLDDVRLKALEREASANRQLLENLLARYVEVNTRKDFDVRPTLARIIQKAAVPTAITFPKPGPIVLLTTLAGLGLGLGLAFLSAIMRMTSSGAQSYEQPPYRARPDSWQSEPLAPPPPSPMTKVQPSPPVVAAVPETHYRTSVAPVTQPVDADARVQPAPAPAFVASAPTPEPEPAKPEPQMGAPEPAFTPVEANTQLVPQVAFDEPNQEGHAEPESRAMETLRKIAQSSEPAQQVPASSIGEAGMSLTGNLLSLRHPNGATSFAFCRVGSEPAESAMAVFRSACDLAAARNRVLVMDLDHERAELERLFKLPEGHGFLDLLAGQSDFSKLIARHAESGVHVIRLGDISHSHDSTVLADRVRAVFRSVNGIYDFILLHAGRATSECLPFIMTCDVAVIVAPPSHDKEVVLAMETLVQNGPIQILHVAVDRNPAVPGARLAELV